jgi:hypothetical protein
LLSGGDTGPTYSPGLVTDLSPASSEVNPKETGPEDLQRYNTILKRQRNSLQKKKIWIHLAKIGQSGLTGVKR